MGRLYQFLLTLTLLTTAGLPLARGQVCPASNEVIIDVVADPSVTTSGGTTVCTSGTATLAATPAGGTGTCTLQWQSSADNSTWANISGATSNSYTTPALTSTTYYRATYNCTGIGCDATVSNVQTVTVVADPSISTQPTSATICFGGSQNFTVAATGGVSLTYQWQFLNGATWQNVAAGTPTNSTYAGATTTTLTVSGNIAAGTYQYRAVASSASSGCDPAVSTAATLTIVADASISSQPASATICLGGSQNFSVSATGGNNLTYQWQYFNGSSWVNVSNGTPTNATYSGSANTMAVSGNIAAGSYQYRVLINSSTNGCDAVTSSTATLTIVADPTVSTSGGTTICTGGTANLTASTGNGTGTCTIQWQSSADGSTGWANISGANSASYTTAVLTSTTFYRATYSCTGSGCDAAVSNSQQVTVVADPSISSQPTSASICFGGSQNFTVAATGGVSLTYQWQFLNGSTWENVAAGSPTNSIYAGATTTTLTVSGNIAAGSYQYRAVVSDAASGCGTVASNPATLTIVPDPSIAVNPPSTTSVCEGGDATMTVVVTDGTGTFNYQWQTSPNGSTGWTNTGNNGATLTPITTVDPGTYYYRVIISTTGSGCETLVSTNSEVIVVDAPDVAMSVNYPNVCVGGAVRITSTVTGGAGQKSYQWEVSPNGSLGSWTVLSGETQNKYDVPTTVASSNFYRVIVSFTGSGCNQAIGAATQVIVAPDATATASVDNSNVCVGGTATLTATVSGGAGTNAYQWQQSNNGTSGWSNISGATAATYSAPTTVAGTKYYRVVADPDGNDCDAATSNNAAVVVAADPSISTQPTGASICFGGSQNFTVAATGGVSLVYQWQFLNGSTWENVAAGTPANSNYTGATTTTLTVSGNISTGSYQYRAVVSDAASGCNTVFSNPATLTVAADPSISSQPSDASICFGGSQNFTVAATGGVSLTYQWQFLNGSTWENVAAGTPANSNYAGATTTTLTVSGNISTGSYQYRAVVSDATNGCNTVFSNPATLTIAADPTVSTSGGTTICTGGTANLTATTSNGTGTCTIQWQSSPNGSTGWANISGANSASYTTAVLTSTTFYRATYSCTGSGCDAAVSNSQQVTVVADPSISTQPTGASICFGGSQNFSVAATGGVSLTYQWQFLNGSTWENVAAGTPANSNYTGATTTTLTVSGNISTGSYQYRAVVSDATNGCNTVFSNPATLTIAADPTVSTSGGTTICTGGTANLTATTGNGTGTCTIQWQSSPDGSTGWANISGATAANYTTAVLTTTTFYRAIYACTGNGCDAAVSNVQQVTVVADPTSTIVGANITICSGGSTDLTASITDGGTGTPSYQWQKSENAGSTWADIAGATASTFNTGALTTTTHFRVVINFTGNGCNAAISTVGIITVVPDPSVSISGGTTVCESGSTTLTATTSGGTGTCTLQWQQQVGASWVNISGANSASFTTPALTQTTIYRATFTCTGGGCDPAVSNEATVTVVAEPTISDQPDGSQICVGGSTTMTSIVSGGTGALTYQWQIFSGGSWQNVAAGTPSGSTYSGATSNSLSINTINVSGNFDYRVLVNQSGSGCGQIVSATAPVEVFSDPSISSQPSDASICFGGSQNLTVAATGGVSLEFQWQFLNGSTWENVAAGTPANSTYAGATTTTLTVSGNIATGNYQYRAVVSDATNGCNTVFSNPATLTVAADPTVSSQPSDASICFGGSQNFAVAATGSVSLNFQWQFLNGSTWENVAAGTPANSNYAGATTTTLTVSGNISTGSYQYRAVVSDAASGCGTVFSNPATLTIAADPTVSTSGGTTICTGGTANLTATTGNGTGTCTIQWQSSPDGSTGWANISGATAANYTTAVLTSTTFYRAIYSCTGSGCDAAVSNNQQITVVPDPTASIVGADITICSGGSATLNANITDGGTGTPSYQWQLSTDGGSNWANISGATASSLNTGALTQTTAYRVVISFSGNGCNVAISTVGNLTVVADPQVSVAGEGEICPNGSRTLTATTSGGTGTCTLQWQQKIGNSWLNISGATAANFTTPALTATTIYRAIFTCTGGGCDPAASNEATVTVVAAPTISSEPEGDAICVGGSLTLAATVSGGTGAVNFQWQFLNGSTWENVAAGTPSGSTYAGATSNSLTISGITTVGNFDYRVLVNVAGSGCGQVVSQTATVQVLADPSISSQPASASICFGGSQNFTVGTTGGESLEFEWQFLNGSTWETAIDNSPANSVYAGATTATLTVSGNISTGNYQYRVLVRDAASGCNTVVSSPATLTVVADPSISSQPASATICVDGNQNFTVAATGGLNLTYQWQFENAGNWENVAANSPTNAAYAGATSTTLNVSGNIAPGNYNYRVLVSDAAAGCNTVASTTAVLTITPDAFITTTGGTTICSGGTATLASTVGNGTGTCTIQWQNSPDGTTGWANIGGANSANFTTPALTTTTFYRALYNCDGSDCDQAVSNVQQVTVVADPSATIIGANVTLCSGGSTDLTASITDGGTGTPSYQWQKSENGGSTWASISGATNSTLNTGALTTTTHFRVVINFTGNGCNTAISTVGIITVVPDPSVSISGGTTVCESGSTTLTATTSGGTGTCVLQWQRLVGASWVNIAGQNAASFTTPALTQTTTYRATFTCTGGGCDPAVSNEATVTVVAGPTISDQPDGSQICVGGSTTMQTVVSGGTGAVNFQWQFLNASTWENVSAGSPSGSTYSGSTSNLLTINGISISGNFEYRVLASQTSSGCGQVVSATAPVEVFQDPAISTQPISSSICFGGSQNLTVAATGGVSLEFQWQFLNGSTWENVAAGTPANSIYTGETTTTLNVSGNISTGNYQYRVLVTDAASGCNQATSETATISIVADPVISDQPDNAGICVGGSCFLQSTVSGGTGATTFQWQINSGGSWQNVAAGTPSGSTYSGANSNSLTINGISSPGNFEYRMLANVAGSGCGDLTSTTATVQVRPTLGISSQPANASICFGGTANLAAAATGGVNPTFQWEFLNGSTWENVSNGSPANSNYAGATTTTLTISGNIAAGNYQYRMVVNDASDGCFNVPSTDATLTIAADPSISSQPASASICFGGSQNFTVAATGGVSLEFQWQFLNGSTWENVAAGTPANSIYAGATTTTLNVSGNISTGNYQYRVLVSDAASGCGTVASSPATLTIVADPSISTSGATTICAGGTANLTSTPADGTGNCQIQWQSSPDGSTAWANIGGANSPNFTTPALTSTTFYRTIYTCDGSNCDLAVSNVQQVTVVPDPTASIVGADITICSGGSAVLTANITDGGTGTPSYEWQLSTDGGSNWSAISGATASTLNTGALTQTTAYRVIISFSGNGCGVAISTVGNLTVVADPQVSVAGEGEVCPNGSRTLTASTSGGTGTCTLQWQRKVGNSWLNISGQNAATFTTPALSTTTIYRTIFTCTGGGCDPAASNEATVTVVAAPSISSQPEGDAICVGGSLTMSVSVAGGTGVVNFQWQIFTAGAWANVSDATPTGATYSGATANSLTINGISISGNFDYRVLVNLAGSGCGQVVSQTATVQVLADPSISSQPASASICFGGSHDFTVGTSGGESLEFEWQFLNGSTWETVIDNSPANSVYAGSTTATLTVSGNISTGNYEYRVVVRDGASGCATVVSSPATLTVVADPVVTVAGLSDVCVGAEVLISASSTGGVGTCDFQWQERVSGVWQNVSGAVGGSFTTPPLSANSSYRAVLICSGSGCCD